jgi:hypothetical protein
MNTENLEPKGLEQPGSLPSLAASRRRMMLKSLGRGSAVLAASVPIQTMAFTTLIKNDGQICSISGMQSGAHSRPPTTTACAGYSPGWWKQFDQRPHGVPHAHWPATLYTPPGTLQRTYDSPISGLFNGGKVPQNTTLWDVARIHENSEENHWLCAWLNAQTLSNFPYTALEIETIYGGLTVGSLEYFQALNFFKSLEGYNAP